MCVCRAHFGRSLRSSAYKAHKYHTYTHKHMLTSTCIQAHAHTILKPRLPSSYLICLAGCSRVGLQQRFHYLYLSLVCSCIMQWQPVTLRKGRQRPMSALHAHTCSLCVTVSLIHSYASSQQTYRIKQMRMYICL